MTSELFVAEQCWADCTTSTHCVPPELNAIFAEHRSALIPARAGLPRSLRGPDPLIHEEDLAGRAEG
jgi:hypothetical protein